MYIHHTHAVTSTKKRNIARSLNRWLINQPSFSSVFIHESRGDARHCGSRAGKLSPSRDTTVFTPSKHNGLSRFPVIFFLFFFPRHFFDKHSLSVTSRYPKKIHFRNYWTSSLAAKFKGVESHFCFPPCLTPFTTTPAVPLSHSSNLSPSSPFLSFHQGSRGMLITERRRYRFEESAVARIFTRPANVNTIYIYVLYTLPTMRYHGDEKIHENNDLGRCRVQITER